MERKEGKKVRVQMSPEEEKHFVEMVTSLGKAVLQTMSFGAENPLAKKSIKATYSLIRKSLEKADDITFYIHEGKLNFKGFPLAERNPIVNRLVSVFKKDRIISIRFKKDFSEDSFLKLLTVLGETASEFAKTGGIEQLDHIAGININPVTYELLEEDEEASRDKAKEEEVTEKGAVGEGIQEKEEGESRFTDEDFIAGKKKGKVVIVDSDVRGLISTRKVLVGESYAVATTRSGVVALEFLKGIEVDLVICAHNSKIDGIGACENISQDFPNVVKILMLDKTDISVAIKAINNVSIYKIVIKPWDIEEMKSMVKMAVTQRKLIIADELLSQELKRREVTLRKDREKLASVKIPGE